MGKVGNIASAKAALASLSHSATFANADNATNLGSPWTLGNSVLSCVIAADESFRSHFGCLRAMRSHAVMKASCGPMSYNFRSRFLRTECHFGSVGFASDSLASWSSLSTLSALFRCSAPWCKATPRSEAAAACNGRPVDAPGSMRHVATPAQM